MQEQKVCLRTLNLGPPAASILQGRLQDAVVGVNGHS